MMSSPTTRRILAAAGLLCLALLAGSGVLGDVLTDAPGLGTLDRKADAYYDDALRTALYTFAVARGLNAVISLVQEMEITPVVVNVPLGQLLDPVNDLVERFSLVMLVSTASLGIQQVLMQIASWLGLRILLTTSALILLASLWLPARARGLGLRLGVRVLLISLFVRLCLPVVAVTTGGVQGLFLEASSEEAAAGLEASRQEMERLQAPGGETEPGAQPGPTEPGMWEKLKGFYDSARSQADLGQRVEQVRAWAAGIAEDVIRLIVAYVLQTILVPLLVLWVLLRMTGLAVGRGIRALGRAAARPVPPTREPHAT